MSETDIKSTTNGSMRMLNLGCGKVFHADWVNMDYVSSSDEVICYDLNLGIPFADDSFDIIYHSHILEHFSCERAIFFLKECARVLRPGGILRVVVPDLENIARAYLKSLDGCRTNEHGALEQHEWMNIELLDQMTRQKSGGRMLEYWRKNPMPAEEFVIKRNGQEVLTNLAAARCEEHQAITTEKACPTLDTDFLLSGELHKWMYDEVSLTHLLRNTGFCQISRREFNDSSSPYITEYAFDVADGKIRKPDSMFIEARKPEQALEKTFLPNVAILSTIETGGAGIAALRQHLALNGIGYKTQMYVAHQRFLVENLHLLPQKKQRVTCTGNGDIYLQDTIMIHKKLAEVLQSYKNRPSFLEHFSNLDCCARLADTPFLNDFSIINLQWVSSFISPTTDLETLRKFPVVWTLHDMRPFTGGCHYNDSCRGYLEHCGQCPQLGSTDSKDLSFETWRSQKIAYRELDLHVVTPSQWLADEAGKSSLFKNFSSQVIRYPQPLHIFKPLDRKAIRQFFKIPDDSLVLLFSAHSLFNLRKGITYLLKSLYELVKNDPGLKLHLILLGDTPPKEFSELNIPRTDAGYVDQVQEMAIYYNAADAVVVPSLEDNSPNVISEAAGCGIPVIAFGVGGIPEMIKHLETGYIAPPKDVSALVKGIYWAAEVKKDPSLRHRCRAWALENWSPAVQAEKYKKLYLEIYRNWQKKMART